MGVKTFECPNCTCVQHLPQTDDDGATVNCLHCKVPITISKSGKVTTAPLAPKS